MSANLSSILKALSGASKVFNVDNYMSFINNINNLVEQKRLDEERKKAAEKLSNLEEKLDKLQSFSPEDAQSVRDIFSLAIELSQERKPKFGERVKNALYGISSSLLGRPVPPEKDTSFENALSSILGIEQAKRALAAPYANLYSAISNALGTRESLYTQRQLAQMAREAEERRSAAARKQEEEKNRLEKKKISVDRERLNQSLKLAAQDAEAKKLENAIRLLQILLTYNRQQPSGGPFNFEGALRGLTLDKIVEGNLPIGQQGGQQFPVDSFIRALLERTGLVPTQSEQVPSAPVSLPAPVQLPQLRYEGVPSAGNVGISPNTVIFSGDNDKRNKRTYYEYMMGL